MHKNHLVARLYLDLLGLVTVLAQTPNEGRVWAPENWGKGGQRERGRNNTWKCTPEMYPRVSPFQISKYASDTIHILHWSKGHTYWRFCIARWRRCCCNLDIRSDFWSFDSRDSRRLIWSSLCSTNWHTASVFYQVLKKYTQGPDFFFWNGIYARK